MPPMMGGAGGAAGKPGVAGGMAPGVDPNAASALGGSALRSGAAPAAANTAALGTTGALGGPNGLGTGGPGGSTGGLGGLGGLGGGPMAAGGSDLPMVDTDGDGIPDTYMRKDVDSDGDGISDYDEWLRDNGGRLGSDPGGDNGGGPGGDDNGRYGTDPLPWDNDGPEIPPGTPRRSRRPIRGPLPRIRPRTRRPIRPRTRRRTHPRTLPPSLGFPRTRRQTRSVTTAPGTLVAGTQVTRAGTAPAAVTPTPAERVVEKRSATPSPLTSSVRSPSSGHRSVTRSARCPPPRCQRTWV